MPTTKKKSTTASKASKNPPKETKEKAYKGRKKDAPEEAVRRSGRGKQSTKEVVEGKFLFNIVMKMASHSSAADGDDELGSDTDVHVPTANTKKATRKRNSKEIASVDEDMVDQGALDSLQVQMEEEVSVSDRAVKWADYEELQDKGDEKKKKSAAKRGVSPSLASDNDSADYKTADESSDNDMTNKGEPPNKRKVPAPNKMVSTVSLKGASRGKKSTIPDGPHCTLFSSLH
jgi:hypothetical protein